MSLPIIREQIKTIISGVSGIGVEYDYFKWAVQTDKMLEHFKDANGRINTAMFRQVKMAKRTTTIGGGSRERARIFQIRVIMAHSDAKGTGILFENLLSAIEEKFDSYKTLNGTCLTIIPAWGPMAGQAGVQIDLVEERMFGGVLCHYAELHLCAIEQG
jgi:hypothetical protein